MATTATSYTKEVKSWTAANLSNLPGVDWARFKDLLPVTFQVMHVMHITTIHLEPDRGRYTEEVLECPGFIHPMLSQQFFQGHILSTSQSPGSRKCTYVLSSLPKAVSK